MAPQIAQLDLSNNKGRNHALAIKNFFKKVFSSKHWSKTNNLEKIESKQTKITIRKLPQMLKSLRLDN